MIKVAARDGTRFIASGAIYFVDIERPAGLGETLHSLKNLDVSVSYDPVINTKHMSAQRGTACASGIGSELDWMAGEVR